jgi:hypothetical protein
MALKKAGVTLFAAAMAVSAAIIPSAATAASTQAGSIKSQSLSSPVVRKAANFITLAAAAEPLCGVEQDWCIWTGTYGTGSELVSYASIPNLGSYGFRNEDASLEAEAGGGVPYLVRFYYSPNYSGAWICVDGGTYLAKAANYTFNNGGGLAGYGQNIYHNIASVSVSGGSCSNPTG